MKPNQASLSLLLIAVLVGCAGTPTGPAVKYVCTEYALATPDETAYLQRRVAHYLAEYGFAISDSKCDVKSRLSVFGGFQAEAVAGGLIGALRAGSSGYWSLEGIHNVSHQGQAVLSDAPINLRGYKSKQELYDNLAWQLVKPITRSFRADKGG